MAGPIAFYAPDPTQSTQLIPGGNTPASGAQLFVYTVGTSTKQNSYTDPSASTARTNPIVLDSGGNIPGNGEVWITSSAKFVLAPSNDTDPPSSPYWTRDNVPGINNITSTQVAALSSQNEWVLAGTPTFVGVTAFTLTGDQTAIFTFGRRIKATVTGGDRFGIVTSSAFGVNTAVGVTLDSSTLNAGLSAVSYGILSASPNGSVPWAQETSTGVSFYGTLAASTALFFSETTSVLTVGSSSPAILGYVVMRKTADETISGTTTVQNDDHLFFPTPTNAEWIADYFIDTIDNVASTPTGIKIRVNVPVGATTNIQAMVVSGPQPFIPASTGAIQAYTLRTSSTNAILDFTTTALGLTAANQNYFLSIHAWILNATNTGNIQLQWSPSAAAGASGLTFRKGSHLTATRIA